MRSASPSFWVRSTMPSSRNRLMRPFSRMRPALPAGAGGQRGSPGRAGQDRGRGYEPRTPQTGETAAGAMAEPPKTTALRA
ncbi:hypothetical protein SLA_2119 [Streptomyces laurentii]|uniref:Uncharacterized protein n=1 Tax=Streptomyces laurentii TaxID=39478 RepID=A0A160NYR6_STRLU|nr:hypothetical protein SLA_2119 [Streptomyces laurentii]